MGAEENHQGKIISHNIPFAFSGSHIISYKTQDDILLTGSQVWWWWNVEIVEGSNLCAGQFEEGRCAHRSRGGYWGAIWTRCGIQSGLITIFTSSTWYLTTHESQIFQVSIPAFTALKESCKQANLTLFYCNFFNILSYTTY